MVGEGNGHSAPETANGEIDIEKELPAIEAEKQQAQRLVESTPATLERADQVLRELEEALLL